MTIDQLKYLLAINHCRSMTQAAQELYISHQALSASIKSLEKELGTPLLCKTTRGTTLTLKGKQLVEISTDFIDALNHLFFTHTPQPETISLRIAANYVSITNYLAAHLTHASPLPFILEPIFLEYANNEDILTALQTGLADIGFCAFFRPHTAAAPLDLACCSPKSLEYQMVCSLTIFCEMSPAHPLAYLEQIPFNKLHKYPLRYFYPRLISQTKNEPNRPFVNDCAFHFTHFFQQFNFALETNPTLYNQALQNTDCIGIAIAENAATPYGLLRIPLQADCYFDIVAIRPYQDSHSVAEEMLYNGFRLKTKMY